MLDQTIDLQVRVQTITTALALLDDGVNNAKELLIHFTVAYN